MLQVGQSDRQAQLRTRRSGFGLIYPFLQVLTWWVGFSSKFVQSGLAETMVSALLLHLLPPACRQHKQRHIRSICSATLKHQRPQVAGAQRTRKTRASTATAAQRHPACRGSTTQLVWIVQHVSASIPAGRGLQGWVGGGRKITAECNATLHAPSGRDLHFVSLLICRCQYLGGVSECRCNRKSLPSRYFRWAVFISLGHSAVQVNYMEVEDKVERVKQKRRESAQRSRARKNQYMRDLEVRCKPWVIEVLQALCSTVGCQY